MTLHRSHPAQHGFSMLEVLIAVLVFSLGMIGLAGLLVFSIQSNHIAYLRTQATFLAQGMASRMGANPVGLWNGDYNISAIDAAGAPVPSCDSGCDPAALAAHDIAAWSLQLHTFLPAVTGNINCGTNGIAYNPTAQVQQRPPYGGSCTMTLTWNEAGTSAAAQAGQMEASAQGQQPHTFQWVFQP